VKFKIANPNKKQQHKDCVYNGVTEVRNIFEFTFGNIRKQIRLILIVIVDVMKKKRKFLLIKFYLEFLNGIHVK